MMKVYDNSALLENIPEGLALSIGNFDGLHLGHKKIIESVKTAVKQYDLAGTAAMTFEPHPAAILHPEKAPGILTPPAYKKQLLEDCGIEHLIVITDSYELLNLSPADFVSKFLVFRIKPRVVVEGPDFNFGYGRSGDVNTLRELGKGKFEVVIVEQEQIDIECGEYQGVCSSSLIRCLLENGKADQALSAMGRPYRLIGKTVGGRGIGKQIGFPTANIEPVNQVVPAEGVYAGFVSIAETMEQVCGPGQKRAAAISIGRAKTFISDHPLLIEAHLLDEDPGPLGDKFLAMDFIKQLRHQQRFESKDVLAEQIEKDCRDAKSILDACKHLLR
ncbi:MAG: riboflavin biosynthesis protein RibF [Sedimentisphaerales bacterium]|nr:riboflavin biosynthesis protein RibF [Sedimentisphaerales bacterium]